MREYTIIYAVTRALHGHGECHHHLARVTAENPRAAEELCRADTIVGFSYQTLAMFEGHLTALDVGDRVLHHTFNARSTP